ncbi:single-stranded DNA-binding protein [Streptosporangium saharense]|uniref:Single-stranded DNA-binding protein n=1 Tax=Streptosporangium saharense TaxID=1706840 RepID=A0A7W7QTG9_9ACTN|nr:single-stranded DNA-binding protein [Streptosporangium saharense]MBB4919428.1 single-stranded DNA-binding protein [Streptosporangium saharense]
MDRNEVRLVGRLPEAARIRSLQNGSTLGTWRMIVRRQRRGRGSQVDTIPCASFEHEVTVTAAEWLADDMVEVEGALRRRWWGSEGTKSSGYEVEVRSARRLGHPDAPVGGREGETPDPTPPAPVREPAAKETPADVTVLAGGTREIASPGDGEPISFPGARRAGRTHRPAAGMSRSDGG